MRTTDPPDPVHEERIRQFELDWAAGRRPTIEEYVTDSSPSGKALLIELVHIDLELRLKAAEPARAAEYFARYPVLAADSAAAADLIAAEHEFRRRKEPGLTREAVSRHYPAYQFQLESWMNEAESTSPHARGLPSAPGYQILEPLGQGGMGEVYKARDSHLERIVALKFLPSDYVRDPGRLALFHREARTASSLNHPHICTIHDLGEHHGRPYIVMEFIEGHTLRTLIGHAPEWERLARLMAQAAKALAVAHAAGVVHRDIKPENLMIRSDGYLKVLDFGLARRLPGVGIGELSTHTGSDSRGITGTVPYMSPEQAQSEPPGPASDIFSLGVVLYQLATGRHPFSAASPLATLNAIVADTPISPTIVNPDIPAPLEALIARMLQKSPADRPSAAEVDGALTDIAAAPGAPPPSPGQRAARHTIGRLAELAGLRSALETAIAGSGEMVCIVGESGIGKTTLVEEFLEELSRPPGLCFVGSGRCSERLADAEAYLPVLEVLDSLLRGPSGNLAAHCLRGLAPGWYAELFPHAREVHSCVLDEARGEPTPPRLKREFLAFLKELARQGVVVVFIDDIQWADLPTADLLAYLGRHLPAMRLLVVVTYRRDEMVQGNHPFLAAQRDLQARGVCRELAPELLGHADIDRYLELTFPTHDFPTEFSKSIQAKTGGNPLFVADLVRYLRDRGIIAHSGDRWRLVREVPDAAGEMPASIRGLILRKLDRLDPGDRRILAGAAVQGAEFDSAVVARAVAEGQADVEDRLQELDHTHGLVRRLRENEFPDRTLSRRYRFVHAIYQESLVSELSPARRGAISNALADASLALQNGQAGLAAAELACLYESGRNLGLAAELFHTAAENAARLSAHREALRLACRGLGLLRGLPDTSQNAAREFHLQMTIGLQLQLTHGYAAPGVDEAYGRAREIWERSPAVGKLFPILWGLWLFHKVRSDLGRANLLAGELLALAEQLGDAALALQAHQAGAVVALCAGEPTATRRHMEAALRLYDPGRHAPLTFTFGQDPGVACQAFGAVALWLLGHPEEARSRSEEAVRIARAGSQPSSLALALHFAGVLHQFADNPAVVREFASEALAVAVEHQFAFWQAGATILLDTSHGLVGDGPNLSPVG